MSVKVNLLPDEIGARSKASGQRGVLVAAFVALLALVAGGWWFNEGRVTTAETELAAAETAVVELRAEIAELQPFSELEQRSVAARTLLATALGGEASAAGIMQDLSSVFPPNAQLEELTVTLTGETVPLAGGERVVYGQVAGVGRLLLGIAPGAERLLIDLDRAAAFDNPFVTMAVDEDGVGDFVFDFQLGPEVLTNRYASLVGEVTP